MLKNMEISSSSMQQNSGDQLTFLQEDSHAKTLVLQTSQKEEQKESMVREVVYGKNMPELFGKLDLDTSSLKTAQCSLFEDSSKSYAILPEWGTMQNGGVYSLRSLVSQTIEREFMELPTPIATDALVLPANIESYKKLFEQGSQEKLSYHFLLNGLDATQILENYESIMGFPKDWTRIE